MKTIYRYLATLLLASLVATYTVDVCANVSDDEIVQQSTEESEEQPLSLRQRAWQKMKKHPRRTLTVAAVAVLSSIALVMLSKDWQSDGAEGRGGGEISAEMVHGVAPTEVVHIHPSLLTPKSQPDQPTLPEDHWRHSYPKISSKDLYDRLIHKWKTEGWSTYEARQLNYQKTMPKNPQEKNDAALRANTRVIGDTYKLGGRPIRDLNFRLAFLLYLFGCKEAWDKTSPKLLTEIKLFRNRDADIETAEYMLKRLWDEWQKQKTLGLGSKRIPDFVINNMFEDNDTNAVVEFWKESRGKD